MARIVTSTYRYKPPPKRKGRKLAEITGPAIVTSVDPKRGSRRRDNQGGGQKATAAGQSTRLERADQQQPTTPPERQRDPVVTTARKTPAPANADGPRKSAIVTSPDRKTAQRQREQQQMAKLMATEEVSPETKDLVDRMMLGRWPGSVSPKKLEERT